MRPHTGPSLPQSLLEEIESTTGEGRGGRQKNGRHKGQLPRKEARRQEREGRRQRKAEYFTGRAQNVKRPAEDEHVESPRRKKQRLDTSASSNGAQNGKQQKAPFVTVAAPEPLPKKAELKGHSKKPKPKTALERLAERSSSGVAAPLESKSKSKAQRSTLPRSRQEQEEDAYIAHLEAKLGWNKGGKRTGKYGKDLEDDGLDELLHDLDQIETSAFFGALAEYDEDKVEGSGGESDEDISEIDNSDEAEDDTDQGSEEEVTDGEEEWGGIIGGESESEGESEEDRKDADEIDGQPTRAIESTAASKYIPPHLRNRPAESPEDSEAKLKLMRQIKGQLNRMSEQNIGTIIDAIEEIYRNHRRHDATSTITTLIIDGISAHSILLDSYVVLHAAFVSALHKLVGVEFAAYFVQNVVSSYEHHFAALQNQAQDQPSTSQPEASSGADPAHQATEVQGKETSNLIVLLSELYNFQVISCILIYDVIRGLLEGDLTEFKVELVLKIARNSGQQLRTDDPSALKDIIQIVHSKLPEDKNSLSSRTRFMVETLGNLKNNKVKRTAAGQQAGNEAVERMKKFLSGLIKKRQVKTHEPLRVGLDDLHSAESRGKWWLVGAAWGGDPLADRQESNQANTAESHSNSADATSQNTLLKLARKQGMNTDIRRSIFIVLMSSEDYVHACERLSQLKLTEVQQREIIRVILHCCGNEKVYNPYYTLIGQQLCRLSHSHKFTLQYCLWDFLRDLGEVNVGGAEIIKNLKDDVAGFDVKKISSTRMANISRAYGWWIAKDCITLAVLKPVDFTILKSQSRKFLVQLLVHVFISSQLSSPLISSDPKDIPRTRNRGPLEEIFIKATRIQTLALGLVYFLGQVVKHEVDQIDDAGFLSWASKVALDTLRTGMDVVPTL
ncbi:unnamed protein product [Somion occarium]|uniref:MI domain-containing protein n=1 Tax=Somion occarium TaxID=3059160 RepID=A0ABP1E8F9_9APHY